MSPFASWNSVSLGGFQRTGCADAIRWLSRSASTVTSWRTQLDWLRARAASPGTSNWSSLFAELRSRLSCHPVPV